MLQSEVAGIPWMSYITFSVNHSVVVHEPSTFLDAKDGKYEK